MNKKHPLHDIIIAYANGEKLQYKLSHDNEWYDVYEGPGADSPNFNVENIEWRIKPETKIVRFKLGLFKSQKQVLIKLLKENAELKETNSRLFSEVVALRARCSNYLSLIKK